MVWRAIPRQGKLPAQLGWNAKRVADECLNLWDEQPHGGAEWFLPLNELQFDRENGAAFPGYQQMAQHLAALRIELRSRLPDTVKLMWPAWVPSDDGTYLDQWRQEAEQFDAICVHCYGSAETMRARYQSYRDAFPGKPLFVGEHNANHEGHDERESLQMWADVAASDPLLLGCAYFIYETRNDGEQDLSIFGNPERLALFRDPPAASTIDVGGDPGDPTPDPVPVPPNPTPITPEVSHMPALVTLDDVRRLRWQAIVPTAPFNPGLGFENYWIAHPEIGSPLTESEIVLDTGEACRPFANTILVWKGDHVEEVA